MVVRMLAASLYFAVFSAGSHRGDGKRLDLKFYGDLIAVGTFWSSGGFMKINGIPCKRLRLDGLGLLHSVCDDWLHLHPHATTNPNARH